jgi:cytidine deaminase
VTRKPQDFSRLVRAALAVRKKAHAPYSKFRVGAAVLAGDGNIYTGVNVENSSYGLTICAERVAVGKAVSAGQRNFIAIAIAAPTATPFPCGACRQVLAEFGDCVVVCADARRPRKLHVQLLSELLPLAFRLGRGCFCQVHLFVT